MGLKHGDEPCTRSKNGRNCIYKLHNSQPMGDGAVRHIYLCRRCGKVHYEDLLQGDVECALSNSGKHRWQRTENITFQQHYRYRDITDLETCSCCGAERMHSYKQMIGYNPHR